MMEKIKTYYRKIKHALKLYPIYKVVEEVQKREPGKKYDMLEVFANTGEHQMPAYKHLAKSIEAWEINSMHEKALRRNLPGATIRITNSMEEADRCEKKFDWIVMDAHMECFGANKEYCEHFEILPKAFRLCKEEAILIFNVIPECPKEWNIKYPDIFGPRHLERRNRFYGVNDTTNLSYDFFEKFYVSLAEKNGFKTEWMFFHQRHLLHYAVMKIIKLQA
ncbi:MAG: hypothetical protein N3F09_00770 [Bacteroidia bacterium]|nr:hypothetical protein [Bacteroidia bacterium]